MEEKLYRIPIAQVTRTLSLTILNVPFKNKEKE